MVNHDQEYHNNFDFRDFVTDVKSKPMEHDSHKNQQNMIEDQFYKK